MPKIRAVLAVLALLLGAGRLGAQGYVVVVNAANPTTALDKNKVNNIFLKRVARWDNGSTMMPVNLQAASPTRDAFSRTVHGKKASLVEAFWQQQIFAGKEAPPAERSADAEVLAYGAANPGAIGYVSSSTPLNGDVKAITIN